MKNEEICLYYCHGTSDKVYQVQLQEHPDKTGWVVNFQFGRRGRALNASTKTPQPIPYNSAKRVYTNLIRSKMVKGYSEGETQGVAYTLPEYAHRVTQFAPQLLVPITEEKAYTLFQELPSMYMQVKHDGERRGVIYAPEGITAANRKGLKVPLADKIMAECRAWHGSRRITGTMDCEDMGSYLVCFDMFGAQKEPFTQRLVRLQAAQQVAHELGLSNIAFDIPFKPENLEEVKSFIVDARLRGEEGIVIRDGSSVYAPGVTEGAWKLKFYEDATCRVRERHPVKRSISLELWHTGYNQEPGWIPVGNCTIPPNTEFPDPGALVEIRYLYAFRDGALYQPTYKGVRTDVGIDAAVTSQLKYKETA